MDYNDLFSLSKISTVSDATDAILGSNNPIPPEVRHYLNLLRSLIRDVKRLYGLRQKRIHYLTATPHDLSEVDGVLATVVLDAGRFEPLLTKYRPSTDARIATVSEEESHQPESDTTAWEADDVKNFCKIAGNLPFQTETIQVTITRLGGGIMQSSINTKPYTSPPAPPIGHQKIENVELFKGLFIQGSRSITGQPVSRQPSSAEAHKTRISLSSYGNEVRPLTGQSHASPVSTKSSVGRTSTSEIPAPASAQTARFGEEGDAMGCERLRNAQNPVVEASNPTPPPNRAFGLQALFQPPIPLAPRSGPISTASSAASSPHREASSLYKAPGAGPFAKSRWTVQPDLPALAHAEPSPPYEHQLQPQPSMVSISSSGSIPNFVEHRRHTQSSIQAPAVYPPCPAPPPIQTRHTISEMSSLPEVVMPRQVFDDSLPEVVVDQPVWLLQRQRQQHDLQHKPPTRTATTQARHVSAKAAELRRMFAPVTKLGETKKILPYSVGVGDAGAGRGAGREIGRQAAVQRHYSSPSMMLGQARARSESQPVQRPMIFELESAASSEVAESIATYDTETTIDEAESRALESNFDIANIPPTEPLRVPSQTSQTSTIEPRSRETFLPQKASFGHKQTVVPTSSVTAFPTLGSVPNDDDETFTTEDDKREGTMSKAFTAAQNLMPTPSVFRRNRNRTDSAAWRRRTQMFGAGQ